MEDEDSTIRRFDVKFTEGSLGFGVETPEGMDEGSVVTEVVPGGPADKGKVRVGDTLVAIGDEDITHLDHEFTHRLISNSKRPIVLHFETTRAKTAIEKDWSELKKVRNDYVSVCRMDLNSAVRKNMIDEQDYQHNLALCYACADGNYDAVKKALIDKEILAVDDTSDNGYIVLNNKGIVETKVDYDIDWQDKNSDEYVIKHSASFNYEFGGDDLGLDDDVSDSNDTKGESKEFNTKASDHDYNKIRNKDNYVVDLKQYMTTQECKELEDRWLNKMPVLFKLPSLNRNVQTMVVNDNDGYKSGTVYVLNDTITRLTKEKQQLEAYITDRLSVMQNQYKQSLLSMRRQHEMELKALEELDGEWQSMKNSLWKGKKK
eukprot:g9151.t1